jgi:hypothetical protein
MNFVEISITVTLFQAGAILCPQTANVKLALSFFRCFEVADYNKSKNTVKAIWMIIG